MHTKKFINHPAAITAEMLEGFTLAHKNIVSLQRGCMVVNNRLATSSRVGVVTLCGSGHEPGLPGLVGPGFIDIAVVGDVFTAPGPGPCIEALHKANRGHGVLFICLNYPGYVFTAKLACKTAQEEGIPVKLIIIEDDIAPLLSQMIGTPRGLAGCLAALKIAGAAANAGLSLEEIEALVSRAVHNTASLGVSSSGATHPQNNIPLGEIEPGTLIVGTGIHGEHSGQTMPFATADAIAGLVLDKLLYALNVCPPRKLLLIVNGTGSTTLMELFIIFRHCQRQLEEKGLQLCANYVGSLLTVQEQAGFHLSLVCMDDELLQLWNAPCKTPYYTQCPNQ